MNQATATYDTAYWSDMAVAGLAKWDRSDTWSIEEAITNILPDYFDGKSEEILLELVAILTDESEDKLSRMHTVWNHHAQASERYDCDHA